MNKNGSEKRALLEGKKMKKKQKAQKQSTNHCTSNRYIPPYYLSIRILHKYRQYTMEIDSHEGPSVTIREAEKTMSILY